MDWIGFLGYGQVQRIFCSPTRQSRLDSRRLDTGAEGKGGTTFQALRL